MKIFTIDPSSATGDVSIEEGAKLDTFTIKNTPDKKFYGLYLGYFRNDLDKQPEDRTKKYFLIHNHINLTDKILYLNPCFKGEEKVFKQGNAIASDSSTDKCIMYLYNDNTRVRAKFDNAKELFINNKLISGCIKSEKTMLSKDGKVIQDECNPAVLIADKDIYYKITFFDVTTKTNRILTVCFNGESIDIISNEEKIKRKRKPEPPKKEINPVMADFFLDTVYDTRHNKKKAKSRYDRDDSDKWK